MKHLDLKIVLALLKYKEMYVRGIAREVLQPHPTISRIMKKLSQANIVSARMEGRNKIFSLKKSAEAFSYACMAEHYKRLELFKKYPTLAVLAEDILRTTSSGLIIIFGSYAKFNAKKDSDIDIYIETNDVKEREKVNQIHSGLSVKTGLFETESILMREIIKNHVILRGVEAYFGKIKVFDETQA